MSRLAHGWRFTVAAETAPALIREFIRPAIRAMPSEMVRQIGACRVTLVADLGAPHVASRWTANESEVEIMVATEGRGAHDIAMELLICLGQILWSKLTPDQAKAYWLLLDAEVREGIPGEIDEDAVREKRALLGSATSAGSRRRLDRYGCASFASTAAEYVHCLWHDVNVVCGPEHLPAPQLRRRLELLAGWFPPDRGYRLYPQNRQTRS